jgi:hypothetical protein
MVNEKGKEPRKNVRKREANPPTRRSKKPKEITKTMQLTLEQDYGIQLTPEGVVFPEGTPKHIVIDAWKRMKFMNQYSGKGERSCRECFEKNWGFDEAIRTEAKIIVELGFEVSARIADSDKNADPIPSTARFVKAFSELRDRWKVAIETGNVEYLKLASDALRPMVEEWNQINEYLAKQEIGA